MLDPYKLKIAGEKAELILAALEAIDSATASIQAIAPNFATLNSVADNLQKIIDVEANELNINAVNENKPNIDILALISNKLESIYADKAKLDSIFADKAIHGSIFADKAIHGSIFADKAILDKVYANLDAITALTNDNTGLATLIANQINVDKVADDITKVNLVADEIVPNLPEILEAETNAEIATTARNEAEVLANSIVKVSPIASSVCLNNDSVTIDNTVVTNGFSAFPYSGSSTAQNVPNGIDFVSSADYSGVNELNYLSTELAINGTFNTGISGWITNGATLSQVNGEMVVGVSTGFQGAYQLYSFTDGVKYRVSWESSHGSLLFRDGVQDIAHTGHNTVVFTASSSTQISLRDDGSQISGSYTLDNISVKEMQTYNTGDVVKIVREGRTFRVVCLQDGVTSDPNTLYDFVDATFSDWMIQSETNGGMAWIKGRSSALNNYIVNTISGFDYALSSNSSASESNNVGLVIPTTNGFTLPIANSTVNPNGVTMMSWSFQTTQVKSGLTNQGKPYIEESNPIAGYTQIKYRGSGLDGHEIPHSLGRELGLWHIKNLTTTVDWHSGIAPKYEMHLNLTQSNDSTSTAVSRVNSSSITLGTLNKINANRHILYGFANAQENEDDSYTGIFDIGSYKGDGVINNKVLTKFKLTYVMTKGMSVAGSWGITDNQRGDGNMLYADLSVQADAGFGLSLLEDGFNLTSSHVQVNALDGQYLYFGIRDNSGGDGKSKYPKPSDSANIQLTNSNFNYTDGKTKDGYTLSSKNIPLKTIQCDGVSDGWKWLSENSDGTNTFFDNEPKYKMDGFSSWFDNKSGKWVEPYNLVDNGDFSNEDLSGWSGQPEYSIINESLRVVNISGRRLDYYFPTVIGKTYRFSCELVYAEGTFYQAHVNGELVINNQLGAGEKVFVATTSSTVIYFYAPIELNSVAHIDNIQVTPIEYDSSILTPIVPAPSFTKKVYVSNGSAQYFDDEISNTYTKSMEIRDIVVQRNTRFIDLPTADPLIKGLVWSNSNVLTISTGA